MKKKFLALLLLMTLIFTSCSGPDVPADNKGPAEEKETETESEEDTISDMDALGDIEVEEELFDVTLTIPAEYVEATTQEELDAVAAEKGYKATLNDDGSATYIMTKNQHKKMLDEMASSLNESLDEMVGSENYPNFTDIKANDNFTEFTITTTSTELDLNESFSVLAFYMYGGMYNIFTGETVDNIHIDFVNADTGEIISSSDSSEAGMAE